jgi:tripartite-type tricarboxylate transporter receptor subunit TctC
VHLIVPFAPAGPSDILARLIGQSLSERLGQQFVIENRPGGGGNIGTEAVVRDPSATSARNFCCDAQRRSCATVW